VGGKTPSQHTGIMEREPNRVGGKLIATSKTGRQVSAYVVPDLGTFASIIAVGCWRPRPKSDVSQSGNGRFV
jgi:hypothetical protein